jgi:hypothetical protein
MFNLSDELERAAAAITISKAAPHAALKIDHELLAVAAVVNRATSSKLRPDALEPGVETIVRENGSEGNRASNM